MLVCFVSMIFKGGSLFDISKPSIRPSKIVLLLFSKFSFPLIMLSAKLGNLLVPFCNVFGMKRSFTGVSWTSCT